ncbi:NKAP domain containing 1 isoform X2 [Centropristis striata]|nr:NKAP domain containing 1 isoform X2 [Centropristis striata]
MSKQTLGKTLLRNVIRHTDAHNKIQEEMEMWKMRGWQVQTPHRKHLSDTKSVRGQNMHCDRVPDHSRDMSRSRERVSEHDDREARYWSRKLYEFEAKDPDRWGHSGFKELYPEEFESDSEKSSAKKKMGRHKRKKSKSDTETSLSKRSKKSSRKKKKKKKKKDEQEKRKKAESSSSDSSSDDSSSDDSSATKEKQRKKRTKSRHKNKKTAKTRGRDEESSSGDSNDEGERVRRTERHKKRKQDAHKDSDSGPNSKKSRKNWQAAGEKSADGSSGD